MPLKLAPRLPSLDGWRAVSIALVLGSHSPRTAGFPPLLTPIFKWCDGDLGVRFFFIISGFLITWLMICEKNLTGEVNLRHFYARRALRILPVYLAFVGTLALLQHFTPFSQDKAAWIGNLTFTTNFAPSTWPGGHLWSLAVEEQFYLIWPGIFLLCGIGNTPPRQSMIVLSVPILLAPLCRVITYKHFFPDSLSLLFSHFSFLNYFDSLAVGCVCAVFWAHHHPAIQSLLNARTWEAVSIALALILIPYGFGYVHLPGRVGVAFGNSFQAGGFAILLLHSISSPNKGFYRGLNWAWIQRIGVLSYSIYIWQQLFCTPPEMFGLKPVWWLSFPGWLIAVLIVASVSYYGFERPLLKVRAYFRVG